MVFALFITMFLKCGFFQKDNWRTRIRSIYQNPMTKRQLSKMIFTERCDFFYFLIPDPLYNVKLII